MSLLLATFDWQSVAALAAVAVAAVYLVRSARLAMRREGRCASGCGSCTQATAEGGPLKPIVTIGALEQQAAAVKPRA